MARQRLIISHVFKMLQCDSGYSIRSATRADSARLPRKIDRCRRLLPPMRAGGKMLSHAGCAAPLQFAGL